MKIIQMLNRFYVDDMDTAVAFYETMFDQKCKMRFCYDEVHLELAQIADVLILAGTDESLKPFIETKATFVVDSIMEFKDFLLKNGALIVRDIKQVPTGMNMTMKHADGIVVEYVEMKKRKD